jgi:hypothetical protein
MGPFRVLEPSIIRAGETRDMPGTYHIHTYIHTYDAVLP